MQYLKRIVCLANSFKYPNGRCVAGRELIRDGFGAWIRPVSGRPQAELTPTECEFKDYSIPELLDIMEVPLSHPEPQENQTENHVIAPAQWVKLGRLPFRQLEQLSDNPSTLWANDQHTKEGSFDCVAPEHVSPSDGSLLLIRPENFAVEIARHYRDGKRTYRAGFDYNGTHYNLSLTDPFAFRAFARKPEGQYPLTNVYITVSLTKPYEHDKRCHKLVAALMKNPPLGA